MSETLQQERLLNVYLPLGYSPDSTNTYPVVYVLDGSMDEDFLHIAGITQFSSFSWLNRMPPCIVVGITNVNRYHDFTYPSKEAEFMEINPDNGGSEKFIEFLSKEVKPLIESRFKTSGSSTIIGQSLGGLLAAEILFKSPDLFNQYLIVSPSLWWDNESLLDLSLTNFTSNKRVYVAVGKEGRVMKRVAKSLYQKMRKTEGVEVSYEYFPHLNHATIMHEAVYNGLPKLF